MFEVFLQRLSEFSAIYGVDPLIFGAIYVGSTPVCLLAIAWIVRCHRRSHSIILPTITATVSFIAVYIYVLLVGQNLPLWVYVFILCMVSVGGFSVIQHVRTKFIEVDHETGTLFPDSDNDMG